MNYSDINKYLKKNEIEISLFGKTKSIHIVHQTQQIHFIYSNLHINLLFSFIIIIIFIDDNFCQFIKIIIIIT